MSRSQTNSTGSALLAFDNVARQRVCAPDVPESEAPLRALADSLAHDLEPVLHAPLPIPDCKARLTRIGGRCPVHGTLLEFDPYAPDEHWCLQCAVSYSGREHHEWWAMGAQLWTAERAVHGAALYAVRGDPRHADLAIRILRQYANQYDSWPNRDNVLGPSRPFFSTYLESIWLLNLCHAIALLEFTCDQWTRADGAAVRGKVLAPSAALIDSFHEGRSNRQVWNEVAVMSAWRLLGDDAGVRKRLHSRGGFLSLLEHGLLDDGTWYEGENYHLFAHRGLWYGVELMRVLQEPLSHALNAKYTAGFVAPFLGVLPDETFPSRRDSQYACSMKQWRTAEWCELGWAHSHDPALAGILARLYQADSKLPRRDTGRNGSTADAERNTLPSALTRADLSWRAVLMADPEAQPATTWSADDVYLPQQGLAVMRRQNGNTYVALEGGELGGGHGHPDQLALTLQTGSARWLQDPGTGSYVSPTLHWYRSTLAHTAPAIDFTSQRPHVARTEAFHHTNDFGWMVKVVDGIANGVTVQRTIVVAEGYLVDMIEWTSVEQHEITVPIAGAAQVDLPADALWTPMTSWPNATSTDPRSFMTDNEECVLHGAILLHAEPVVAHIGADSKLPASGTARAWYAANVPASIQRSVVPGAPGHEPTPQHRLACQAPHGRIVGVWSWPTAVYRDGVVADVVLTPHAMPCVTVNTRDGASAAHGICQPDDNHLSRGDWCIEFDDAHRPTLQLRRTVPHAESKGNHKGQRYGGRTHEASRHQLVAPPVIRVPHLAPDSHKVACTIELGLPHYVPTEGHWSQVGAPTACVELSTVGTSLVVEVVANTGVPVTHALQRANPLDNEPSAINCDGIQWYMGSMSEQRREDGSWIAGGLHVPDAGFGPAGFTMPLVTSPEFPVGRSALTPMASWRRTGEGWTMRFEWPVDALPLDSEGRLAFELVVNECSEERERRRGQLVLSGGGGFGYLAGNRRSIRQAVVLQISEHRNETTYR